VYVASTLPVPFGPLYVVNVKLSLPGGTSGPPTVHGHGGVNAEVTLVVKPPGGAPPLTVFKEIVADCAFAPTYAGARRAVAAVAAGGAIENDVSTSASAGTLAGVDAPGEPPLHAANANTPMKAGMR
jgi:hypothetical protein